PARLAATAATACSPISITRESPNANVPCLFHSDLRDSSLDWRVVARLFLGLDPPNLARTFPNRRFVPREDSVGWSPEALGTQRASTLENLSSNRSPPNLRANRECQRTAPRARKPPAQPIVGPAAVRYSHARLDSCRSDGS